MRILSKLLNKAFEDASKEAMVKLVAAIEENEKYSEWTKHDFRAIIKRFWKWLKQSEDEYPKEVRWIKTTMKNNKRTLPEEILTHEEIIRMSKHTDKLRDKAFLLTLYESGARPGEVL